MLARVVELFEIAAFRCRDKSFDSVDIERSGKTLRLYLIEQCALDLVANESLSAFRLTFTKSDDSLRFVRPQLEVTVTDPSKVKDEVQMQQGMAQLHGGFTGAVNGSIGMLEGFFDDLQMSSLAKRREVKLSRTNKGYQASYSSEDSQVKVDFDGTTKRFEITGGEQPMLVVLGYTDFPGRGLALTSGEAKVGSDFEIVFSAKYDTVDNLLVPTEHVVAERQRVGDKWLSNVIDFQMSDCRVTR